MKTSRLISAAAVTAAIVIAVAWLSGWFDRKVVPDILPVPSAATGADVDAVEVKRTSEPVVEWASGAVESAHRTTIAARILARIEDIEVNAGDLVAAGDVLVRLDARALQSKVQQAREALNAARAQRELAQIELGRAEDLLKRGVATQQRFDQASSALRVAAADVDRLSRALEEAET
ncbi:MAG: efflux RND transporter periplasmic adaptor subunit, partial [Aestuariivirgaceae bacterium]